jgi:hypothetical protein
MMHDTIVPSIDDIIVITSCVSVKPRGGNVGVDVGEGWKVGEVVEKSGSVGEGLESSKIVVVSCGEAAGVSGGPGGELGVGGTREELEVDKVAEVDVREELEACEAVGVVDSVGEELEVTEAVGVFREGLEVVEVAPNGVGEGLEVGEAIAVSGGVVDGTAAEAYSLAGVQMHKTLSLCTCNSPCRYGLGGRRWR